MKLLKPLAAVAALLAVCTASAQTFPGRPIRMLVGYAPGGGADVLARLLAVRLADAAGQQVVVDNRPGAGGTVAAAILGKSVADGHTVYFSDASFVTAPGIHARLPYDTLKDFVAVGNACALPLAFVVHPSVPAAGPAEFMALIKAHPGKYSYGTPGVGTLHHLTTELLKKQTGIQMTHVPYKGAAPAMTDLMGGHIPVAVTSATAALAQVKGGKLRIVGVTSARRIPGAPDIPALAEAMPGFEVTNDLFFIAPAGTAAATIRAFNTLLNNVLSQKELADSYLAQGAIVAPTTPAQLSARIVKDVAKWRAVAQEAGIRAD
jgi:tripartite-type tricarboxylate transporter receptor subunit TctC